MSTIPPEDEDGASCDRCGKPDAPDVMWSHAWQEHLCLVCRAVATEADHRMTLAEKRALDARATG